MTNNKENMQKDKTPSLKSLDINGFKTFVEPTHIEFAQGLNVVLATTKYPVPSGMWDFFDAIRWALGAKQHHGSKILFDSSSGKDCSQVKLKIVDENEKETIITRKFSKDSGEELISDISLKELLRLQKHLLADGEKSLSFGSTKIVAVNSDKQIATQADGMIGITTDEAGVSKAFKLTRHKTVIQ